jgi:hypothetical protein
MELQPTTEVMLRKWYGIRSKGEKGQVLSTSIAASNKLRTIEGGP